MISSIFYQRLQDLADNIAKDQELLKDYEDELRYTNNPRDRANYRREIERQRESVAKYQQEYEELNQELKGSQSVQMQKVESQLQQMHAKMNILLSGQFAIYEDLKKTRQALLNRYGSTEQVVIGAIAEQLDQKELVLTQKLLDAVEANQVPDQQMQQMLALLEQRIPALPSSEVETVGDIIKDPGMDFKHRLKVALPIVPMLVEYEGEIELGSGFNIKSAWEQLVAKLQRN
ncbi:MULTISPECIES: hypothetical protein [unclassified Moorena]|uniref:hypothetical protein n=1 Tax=unclassified Moorena TaxID=2683338 RepID=UPI0013C126F0|nr:MULTISPECIES: hypothetical protein [unclassified Moorena]NEP35922.1 hypothetical protein [Moorena sp. SIO3B2]NET69189.1 hypothetical protein [Moorena sp. SIO1G6]